MNICLIIPTGIGAEIGGHAGDGTPVAKLLASCCDNLITHPNVVNASDINEMTENTWYVEGSILNRFLNGSINLKRPIQNNILIVTNEVTTDLINSVSAGRATIGSEIYLAKLREPLEMIGRIENGIASGSHSGVEELIEQVSRYQFDALGIVTPIKVEKGVALKYLQDHGGINPWGGIEAIVSKIVSDRLDKPVAHSPVDDKESDSYKEMLAFGVVDPREAAELVSLSYVHCILKGLHRAPRIELRHNHGLSCEDIDVLVSPVDIWGKPHFICEEKGIPIIMVKENKTCLNIIMGKHILVNNYLEAAGLIQSWKAGVSRESISRPLTNTRIINE